MKQTLIRIITGIIITAVGVGALLDALNLFSFWSWFGEWWPLLVILGGLLILVSDWRRNYIWATILVVIGTLSLLRNLEVVDFDFFSLIVPIIVIGAGLSILINNSTRAKIDTTTKDSDDIAVFFSGTETSNRSKNYKGGKVSALFGGAMLDLRDAKLSGEATLDVFTFCGGVELRVPRDWKVIVKATSIAGGVENKAQGNDDDKAPVLVLTGSVLLGGVEIKT